MMNYQVDSFMAAMLYKICEMLDIHINFFYCKYTIHYINYEKLSSTKLRVSSQYT